MKLPNELALPREAVRVAVDHVRRYGGEDVETGLFLLAPRGSDSVHVVALTGDKGITRRRNVFAVSGAALDVLFEWADGEDLVVLAQLHSHGGRAFLSPTDTEHGFAVEGFASAVVPRYKAPPTYPARWGWWRYEGGAWRAILPPTVLDASFRCVIFDEEAVRDP